MLLKKRKRGNTLQLIVQGNDYPDITPDKNIWRKVLANIPQEHRHKNSQQGVNKPNQTVSKKER